MAEEEAEVEIKLSFQIQIPQMMRQVMMLNLVQHSKFAMTMFAALKKSHNKYNIARRNSDLKQSLFPLDQRVFMHTEYSSPRECSYHIEICLSKCFTH